MDHNRASSNEAGGVETGRIFRWLLELFGHVEHVVYAGLGIILSITAIMALVGAAVGLWGGLRDFSGMDQTLQITERLLFVLMLAEILYTVRVSIHSGGLTAEPFLIVGLIASIRRVLVITLQSSEATHGKEWSDGTEALFRASMIELAVLAALILTMVLSLFMLRRAGAARTP